MDGGRNAYADSYARDMDVRQRTAHHPEFIPIDTKLISEPRESRENLYGPATVIDSPERCIKFCGPVLQASYGGPDVIRAVRSSGQLASHCKTRLAVSCDLRHFGELGLLEDA